MPYPSDINDSYDHYYDDDEYLDPDDLDYETGYGIVDQDYIDPDDDLLMEMAYGDGPWEDATWD